MTCARCGNALHRLPMFDLPRRVKEFSCLCCGERFWTTQGESKLSDIESAASRHEPPSEPAILEFSPNPHRN